MLNIYIPNTPDTITKEIIPIPIPIICLFVIFSRNKNAAKRDANKITEPLNTGKNIMLGSIPLRLMLRRLYPQLTIPQAITESHTAGAIRGIVLSVLNCTIRDETKNKTVDVTAAASII